MEKETQQEELKAIKSNSKFNPDRFKELHYKHKNFTKGDEVYFFISGLYEDILIPAKGIIVDGKWKAHNTAYEILLTDILIDFEEFKFKFFGKQFNVNSKTNNNKILNLAHLDYTSNEDVIVNFLEPNDITFIIDEQLTYKREKELKTAYNFYTEYSINEKIQELFNLKNSSMYDGKFKRKLTVADLAAKNNIKLKYFNELNQKNAKLFANHIYNVYDEPTLMRYLGRLTDTSEIQHIKNIITGFYYNNKEADMLKENRKRALLKKESKILNAKKLT